MATTQHVSLRVPEDLWRQVKRWALENDLTVSQWVEDAMRRRLAVLEQALDRLRTPAVGIPRTAGSPVPGTDGPSKELTYTDDD